MRTYRATLNLKVSLTMNFMIISYEREAFYQIIDGESIVLEEVFDFLM